jgi:hypothetical protein
MDDENGWRPWRVVSYLVGGAVSLPVVAGFVMLGAGVVVARSMRDIVREAWTRLPMRARPEPVEPVVSHALPAPVVPIARRDERPRERRRESRSDAA